MNGNKGLILAAPASGSGKTTLTLGILRALSRRGIQVRGAKSGPDYIDPRFHEAACRQPSMNLDAWAMREARLRQLASGDGLLVIEGAMGLFDGAPPEGKGASADLARILGLPVVLVIDAARMSQSVAAMVEGFARHDPKVRIAGVILNRVGSQRHRKMLETALAGSGVALLGAVMRNPSLALPERHLGLVQAEENPNLKAFLDHAADRIEAGVDLEALLALADPLPTPPSYQTPRAPRHIAIARDAAFTFDYAHQQLARAHAGDRVTYFSPLANDPVPEADRIFLPGGYPELHAERIAKASTFLDSLRDAAQVSEIYGECGGYMVLGETLVDAEGIAHKMAGLLGLATSFQDRRLHLGYRTLRGEAPMLQGDYAGHEFHYATTLAAEGPALFEAWDAEGTSLPPMGLVEGRVCGSFAHVIDDL